MKAPLYLDPAIFLTISFASRQDLYPVRYRRLGAFLILTALAVVLAIRNLRRSGETV
jgi:hypothetical protein